MYNDEGIDSMETQINNEQEQRKKYTLGQKVEIEIEKIVFGGEGLGRVDGFTIFVPMSVPGDKLEVEIISLKKSYGRGLITKIIEPSKDRIDDIKKMTFEDFDGCDFGMLKYEKQIKYKNEMLREEELKRRRERTIKKLDELLEKFTIEDKNKPLH